MQQYTKDKWIGPVSGFLLGELSDEELVRKAEDLDSEIDRQQKCEAYFYMAMKYLYTGQEHKARMFLLRCIATDATTFREYQLAKLELNRLDE